jgi:hypothetical protein
MNKIEKFSKELGYIQNENIRKFTERAVESLPDYFFEVAASSTGRYHPSYALNSGGLLRHTRAAVRIAIELIGLKMFKYSEDEKDIVIVSLILHDAQKHGLPTNYSQYSVSTHPIIAKQWLESLDELKGIVSDEYFKLICENIAHHMGEFTLDYKTKEQVLEEPKTKMQNLVFLCDYLASRKCLEMNFDVEVTRR